MIYFKYNNRELKKTLIVYHLYPKNIINSAYFCSDESTASIVSAIYCSNDVLECSFLHEVDFSNPILVGDSISFLIERDFCYNTIMYLLSSFVSSESSFKKFLSYLPKHWRNMTIDEFHELSAVNPSNFNTQKLLVDLYFSSFFSDNYSFFGNGSTGKSVY